MTVVIRSEEEELEFVTSHRAYKSLVERFTALETAVAAVCAAKIRLRRRAMYGTQARNDHSAPSGEEVIAAESQIIRDRAVLEGLSDLVDLTSTESREFLQVVGSFAAGVSRRHRLGLVRGDLILTAVGLNEIGRVGRG